MAETQRDCRNNPCPVGRPHARYFCCGRYAGMHKCRERRMRKSDKSHQNHFAPRLTCKDALMPRAHGCAGAAFAPPQERRGTSDFASLSGSADGTSMITTTDTPGSLPGPLTGPCFGCTHPRLDRRGENKNAVAAKAKTAGHDSSVSSCS